MGKRITGNFDTDEVEGLKSLKSEEGVEYASEALRIAVRRGLADLGHLNGSNQSQMQIIAQRFGDGFTLTALFLGAFMWLFPVEFRVWVALPVGMALGCYALERLFNGSGGPLTSRLASLFPGGGRA